MPLPPTSLPTTQPSPSFLFSSLSLSSSLLLLPSLLLSQSTHDPIQQTDPSEQHSGHLKLSQQFIGRGRKCVDGRMRRLLGHSKGKSLQRLEAARSRRQSCRHLLSHVTPDVIHCGIDCLLAMWNRSLFFVSLFEWAEGQYFLHPIHRCLVTTIHVS